MKRMLRCQESVSFKKKLNTLKGWITGVRSDQNENRSEFKS